MAQSEVADAPVRNIKRSKLMAKPIGIGKAAPTPIISNKDMEDIVETTDEWIMTRTGIGSRHCLDGTETLRDLEVRAAMQALEDSGLNAADIDLVVVATSSPEDMFGDAPYVANMIGAKDAVAFDLTAACSGFLFATVTAGQYLSGGGYKNAMVIGADALSRWVDWSDRNSCVLFGDGAGAMVLTAVDTEDEAGILGFQMISDGSGHQCLKLPYAGQSQKVGPKHTTMKGSYDPISMAGKDVYKFATREVPRVLEEALANADVKPEDVDWLLLHQANIRIMEVVAQRFGIPMDKVLRNLDEYGNTSAASIPLALAEAVQSGKVKKGDIVATAGFGAGLSLGAAVIRW
eukprot:CAMPEP_0177748574 /NCGR_PEP_ID=MMETSP0484_2-20121128/32007_1 /TAXON_ID=354590 /ORGANISM="Rhodomonas lens, Strain RHODO" /LENGTH=346 /DNA_ID=CAMNT_0019263463 /DNA_START=246 /DNA_END=1283 /DNA_ORIENTATION=+